MQQSLVVSLCVLIGGILLLAGAFCNWSWLVDPPDDWWPYFGNATIKRFLGKKALLIYLYGVGTMCVSAGALGLYKCLRLR
jgi:hypothetical protein